MQTVDHLIRMFIYMLMKAIVEIGMCMLYLLYKEVSKI